MSFSRPCGVGKGHVVVLGAGPAGLSAAWELSRAGVGVTVLEKAGEVGGLCKTVEYRGFRFDLGGHRFITQDAALVQAVKELMGDELLLRERRSTVRLMGQEFRYPLQVGDLLCKLGPKYTLRCLGDCIKIALRRGKGLNEAPSLEDWLVSKFGPTLYRIFFEGYTTKLWGVPPGEMSGDWAISRIPVLDLWDAFLRMMGITRDCNRGYATRFFYPKMGIGQIFEFMSRDVELWGGRVLLNAKVKKVLLKGGQAKDIVFNRAGREEVVTGDWVISTLPLPQLVQILDTAGAVESGLGEHAEMLSFRSLRFLNLLIDMPAISDSTWMYIPESQYTMTRIQEPRHRSPFNVPTGKTSLILEIPCSLGDRIWCMTDDQLLKNSLKELSEVGIEVEASLIDFFCTRAKYAYPVYRIGYQLHRQVILEFLSGIPNLLTCGRGGLFRYLFMDQAMNSGLGAARRVLGRSIPRAPDEANSLIESRSVI